jgi:hypothetical protein
MMNTMHALQMFDNGEYMVITVDMETYSYREAYKYLWRKYPHHLDVDSRPTVALIHRCVPSMFLLIPGTSFEFHCENIVLILNYIFVQKVLSEFAGKDWVKNGNIC